MKASRQNSIEEAQAARTGLETPTVVDGDGPGGFGYGSAAWDGKAEVAAAMAARKEEARIKAEEARTQGHSRA